jgi:predicted amidohydrolase YtcJ
MGRFDILITNGTILSMDPQNSIIKGGFLGIKGDTISYIGGGDDEFEA